MLLCFLLLSNLLCFLQLKKTLHDFFSSNLVKLDLDLDLDPDPDPDQHSEKLLDPDPDQDPHKMNADPQSCQKHNKNHFLKACCKMGLTYRDFLDFS